MKRVRRTYEDIRLYIESFNHTLLSKREDVMDKNGYVKAKTKLLIKCEKGHEFNTCFDVYRNGKFKCKKCVQESGHCRRKYTFNDIKGYFNNEGYTVTSLESDYKNMETVLNVICPRGHKWTSSYNNFQAGYKCPHCKIEDKENIEREELEQIIIKNGYEVIGFERAKDDFFTESLFTIKCKNDHIIKKSVKSIRSNKMTCLECYGKKKKELEEVLLIFEKEGYNVIYHDGYENNQSRFTLVCKNGHKRNTTFASFQQGDKSCGFCSENTNRVSRGEREIARYLEERKIEYIYQYKIEECRLKMPLPFDFYLPKYNLLVEFDGELHYKIIDYFGGLDKFISRKIGDITKNWYCSKNNIPLLRIPYWELNNIKNILDDKLK